MIKTVRVLGIFALASLFGLAQDVDAAQEESIQRIVVFSQKVSPVERLAIAESSGGRIVRELNLIDAVVVRLPAGQVQALEARLKSRPEVLRIDEDPEINWLNASAAFTDVPFPAVKSIIKPFRVSGKPASSASSEIPWGVARVNAQAAWLRANYGKAVKVAVIDTGVDYTHPELQYAVVGGWNAINNGVDWKDDNGHGTHVAGTIAAAADDKGVVGVAPRVALYGVKVLSAGGSGTFSDVIAGMQWAADNKMHVANMSLGGYRGNLSLKAATQALVKAGVTLVAAAGNSGGSVIFPAAYPDAIAVAAADANDRVARFSSRGPEVDFLAPGVDVPSTYKGGGYRNLSGTSMASPHVAGLAALAIAAKGLAGGPAAGRPAAVRKALEAAAVPLANVPSQQQGAGIVNGAKLAQ